jgi:hypothetical protein
MEVREDAMKPKLIFACAFLLASCVDVHAIQLRLPDLWAKPGSFITVEISADDLTGLAGGDVQLDYDPNILLAKEARWTEEVLKGFIVSTNTTNVPGMVRFAFVSLSGLPGGSGVMLEVDFLAKADASGESPLVLDVSLFDELGDDIITNVVDGSVTIGTCYSDLPAPQLIVTGTEEAGDSIKYELSVTNSSAFPDELFGSMWTSPEDLPEAMKLGLWQTGLSSSRTWLEIKTQDEQDKAVVLDTYYTLSSSKELTELSFSRKKTDTQPDYVYITMWDRWCYIAYTSNSALIDTVPPYGDITINNGGKYTNSATVTLGINAYDDVSGVAIVYINNEGESPFTLWWPSGEKAIEWKWALPEKDDGLKKVSATFEDKAGNRSSPDSYTITLDREAPGVVIKTPLDGAVVDGLVLVSATVIEDNSVEMVKFSYDVTTIRNFMFPGNPVSILWDTTAVANGEYDLSVVAWDSAGNYDDTVIAVTVWNTYTITAIAGRNGIISPSDEVTVGNGSDQTFVIEPDSGYHVSELLVDNKSVMPTGEYTFKNVDSNHTIEAKFAMSDYTITPKAGPNGSISPSGEVKVSHGGSATFYIEPAPCYVVSDVLIDGESALSIRMIYQDLNGNDQWDPGEPFRWEIPPEGEVLMPDSNEYTFENVTSNHTIEVKFKVIVYTITATVGASGRISPSGEVKVNCGSDQTFSITPDQGYQVRDVLVDGESIGVLTSYIFTSVASDHTLDVTFEAGGAGVTVWPGDTDNDGIVDARDILPIGVYWNFTGPARESQSTEWKPLKALEWSSEQATYVDANGDGVVDARDILPIGVNWHRTHAVSAPGVLDPAALMDYSHYIPIYKEILEFLESGPQTEPELRMQEMLRKVIYTTEDCYIPEKTAALQNYPNPFNPETWIPYQLAEDSEVEIWIFNVAGELVRKLELGYRPAGVYLTQHKAARWDGRNSSDEEVSSGLYFYRVQAGNYTKVQKMTLAK